MTERDFAQHTGLAHDAGHAELSPGSEEPCLDTHAQLKAASTEAPPPLEAEPREIVEAAAAARPKPAAPEPEPSPSDRIRALIPRSPFRDTALQDRHHQIREKLFAELRVTLFLDAYLVDNLALTFMERDQLFRARETLLIRNIPMAARNVLMPGWVAMIDISLSAKDPATSPFAQFLKKNPEARALQDRPDAEVIAEATAKLAEVGQTEAHLRDRAFLLALEELREIDGMGDRKQASIKEQLSVILALIDRKEAREAARNRKAA